MPDAPAPAVGKDIAAPGTTPAAATSKPVIVGHTPQVADPMVAAAPAATPAPAQAKPAVPAGSSRPKLAPSPEVAAAQAAADKAEDVAEKAEDETAKAEEESQARLQEMIESGEYHVSIGQRNARSTVSTFILTVLAIVVVGVVVLFVLTDLKLIDLGIKLPFHIFKQ